MNFVNEELNGFATPASLFDVLSSLEGEVYREVKTRRTFRFRFSNRSFFAKVHFGVGWREIFKDLIQARLPVLGAHNELAAIRRLEDIGIPTMEVVGYACKGINPATKNSCIVTNELPNTSSLEDLTESENLTSVERQRLVKQVARICREMHAHGLNHRDLYICHFHLALETRGERCPKLHVIDLHRAQLRHRTPERWKVKDIGGLFFSVFDIEFSRRDALRFVRIYSGQPLKEAFRENRSFWRAVVKRATRLYRRENKRDSVLDWIG